MTEPVVHVLSENPEWLPPCRDAFAAEGVPLLEVSLSDGVIDLDAPPPPGVWWSRLSASAHTRGHGTAKETTRSLLSWAEAWGARVVNGTAVAELEVSKVRQHAALRSAGFDVPRTTAVFGRDRLVEAARALPTPFITKHDQGGKGLGVRRFDDLASFEAHVASPLLEEPVDGVTLLQEHLVAAEPFVTRAEFVGGRFASAVRVDISTGSVELCPADACVIDPRTGLEIAAFALREGLEGDPLIARYETFLQRHGIEIAGIEFLETADGRRVTDDVNTNSNDNAAVEAAAAVPAARLAARFLGGLLRREPVSDASRGAPTAAR